MSSNRRAIEVSDAIDEEERGLIMTLSQAYLEWEQETERRGLEQGIEQGIQSERRASIENLLIARFGTLDETLLAIVPALLELPAH